VPELAISNFTSDWKDGKAIGALVDSVAPGLCPDWQDWKTNEGLQNASEAMTLADDWLNVRQVMKQLIIYMHEVTWRKSCSESAY